MKRLFTLLWVLSLSCVGLWAGPILTFTSGPTDYVDSVGDQTIGWSFAVVAPITVTQLMWYDPAGTQNEAHQVGIFSSTGTSLFQACVGATCATPSVWNSVSDHWITTITAAPLAAGSYVIGGKITLNENFVWFTTAVATDPAITYGNNRYHSGGIAITYPESVLANPTTGGVHRGFFGPNFSTDTGVVPEPGTMALFGVGLVLVGVLRKKLSRA